MTDEQQKICAECGGKDTTESMEEHIFPYGGKDNSITLKAIIPIHTCHNPDCGFRWYDYVAEDIIEETVKQHLQQKNK